MKIIEVTYQRKINTGNYENVCIGAKAELGPNDNPQDAWTVLRDNVEQWWIDQQKPKPAPVVQAFTAPKADAEMYNQALKCPKCGGTKKPQYDVCWKCNQEAKK